jgi:hypothetical protein
MDQSCPASATDDDAWLWQTPEYFPVRLLPDEDRLVLVPVSEQLYRATNFLDDRYLPLDGSRELSLTTAALAFAERRSPRRPVHCLFHIAFCGSTLVSRCLDGLASTLVLKEPFPLHELAERRRRIPGAAAHAAWQGWFDLTMALLGRTFHPGQVLVIKPTDASTNLIGDVLAREPTARVLFLYVSPERFLAAVLGDPVRTGFVTDRLVDLGVLFPNEPLFRREQWGELSSASQGVCLWLLHQRTYAQFAGSNPDAACRSLDFDAFLDDPVSGLAAIAAFFGIDATLRDIETAVASAMLTHAKLPEASFSADDRARKLHAVARAHHAEIRAAIGWADRAFDDFQALRTPPRPLD